MKKTLSESLESSMEDLVSSVEIFNAIAEKAIAEGGDERTISFLEARTVRSQEESAMIVLITADLELISKGEFQDVIN